jgi:type IV pilus assembly protein PilE
MLKRSKGFTLIELMIVIAILAIIAAIGLPSFLEQIKKARRSDAKQPLFDVAAKLEQFYQDNKGYPTAADMSVLYPNEVPPIGATFPSPEGYYTIGFNGVPTATTYTIQAVPVAGKGQDEDAYCTSFTLTHLGKKTATGTLGDNCW